MSSITARASLLVLLVSLTIPRGIAPAGAASEEEVRAAIEQAKRSLLGAISFDVEIEYESADGAGEKRVVRGKIRRESGGNIDITTPDGKTLSIPRRSVIRQVASGMTQQEMDRFFYTGPSTLTAFALVTAGVPTTESALAALLDALSNEQIKPNGTYVRSLRACLWSALLERQISRANRTKYQRLLHDDMAWLKNAFIAREEKNGRILDGQLVLCGHHGYDLAGDGMGDNSNGQFAVMGLWSGSVAKAEVSERFWKDIEAHWMGTQVANGGWEYKAGLSETSPSMTVAGCNSLYVVLDRLYARADVPYKLFQGARPRPKAREQIARVYEAIARGEQFLRDHPPNAAAWKGYELFGLERLGVASGQAAVGGLDWFKHYVDVAVRTDWGNDVIKDSFALVFLVYGQAPILIQKLEHGDTADQWNYYHRDLHTLIRYFNHTFERLYRWQRIPVDSSLRTMQDAPILYIAGQQALLLPEETLPRIREYIEWGGTLFLHADLAGEEFTRSATEILESLFKDRGYRFARLPDSHPVYSCFHGGADGSQWKSRPPLLGMSDGSRIIAFLSPMDIAGAWHQERLAAHPDLFGILANIRTYCAPPYGELPSCLHEPPPAGAAAPERGVLTIGRLRFDGPWDLHPNVWRRFAPGFRHRTGIELRTIDGVEASASGLRDCDLVHVALHADAPLDAKAVSALEGFAKAGGLILIEAADGQEAGVRAVRRLFDRLAVGRKGALSPRHPIASGTAPGGNPLGELRTTLRGRRLSQGREPPPILTQEFAGDVALAACPFDLAAGLEAHFIWERAGYLPDSTRAITDNLLTWRAAKRIATPTSAPASAPTTRPAVVSPAGGGSPPR